MENRRELLSYFENISLILIGAFFVAYPLVFSSLTTDAFSFPKQILLGVVVLISLVLFGARMLTEGKVRFRTSPFDLPLLLFTIASFLSAYFSVNRYDSFIAFVPLLFAILAYFIILNVARTQKSLLFLLSALVIGATVSSIISILSFLGPITHFYPLPAQYSHAQTFTTFGSLLDQAIYLALVLPIAGYLAWPLLNKKHMPEAAEVEGEGNIDGKAFIFAGTALVLTVGLLVTLYMLIKVEKPLILPFVTGFQTAFAAISQDAGRVMKSFLFGSGYGTYMTDFTRYKQVAYNASPTLWSFTFFRSSSFILELLATTGFLGVLSFLFIVFKVIKEGNYFLPLILAIIATLLLPFSPTLQALFFVLLGLFAAVRAFNQPHHYQDQEFEFLTARRIGHEGNHGTSRVMPALIFLIIIGIVGALGYMSGRYILSDVKFQQSLVAAAKNDGFATYNLQNDAIAMFKYRDAYYRIFSQTNLALANSLASNQPKNSSPSAATQQNILKLIQQSIDAGRTAVSVAPLTTLNWNNLSSVYRALIGFGQNADQFAVLTNQQAVALDPNNPQQYINLGGIYYQLGQWDEAIRQFTIAVNIKPDYANAYYNLGHALESKGDLQNALQQYQVVKSLVSNDKESVKKMDQEIAALQKKIGSQAKTTTPQPTVAAQTTDQGQIDVNKPQTQLPERNPKATIPGLSITPIPTAKDAPTAAPTKAATKATPTVGQ